MKQREFNRQVAMTQRQSTGESSVRSGTEEAENFVESYLREDLPQDEPDVDLPSMAN
jgi:hypothetical protein